MGNLSTNRRKETQSRPEQLNWRWRVLYSLLSQAKYPLMLAFKLEEILEPFFGLSLIAWGKKE
jgi:hypothetical protein